MPTEVKWAISFLAGGILLEIGWKVYFFLVLMHVVICLILMAVILLQSGEAADLAGAFGGSGSQTAFGPRGAATFLSRATTWCAVMFMFTSGALYIHKTTTTTTSGHSVLEQFGTPPPKPAAPSQQGAPIPALPFQPAPAQPAAPPAK